MAGGIFVPDRDAGVEGLFRPTVTALFCVASRVPMAWAIHADSPSGYDHALLLARAIENPNYDLESWKPQVPWQQQASSKCLSY